MKKYPITISATITKEKLLKGTFIFIYRATRIPPHLGVISNGLLYDITTVGPNVDMPIEDFYNTAVKRGTEVLFVELAHSDLTTNKTIAEKVKKHWKVTTTTSCLLPIKDFLQEWKEINLEKTTYFFDVLPLLEKEDMILGVYELNLQHKLQNNTIQLIKYTKKDIASCISTINRKERMK